MSFLNGTKSLGIHNNQILIMQAKLKEEYHHHLSSFAIKMANTRLHERFDKVSSLAHNQTPTFS